MKHIKAAKDGEKQALFARYTRAMRLAVQEGKSAEINMNSRLASLVEEALRRNMPMATITNTLKKFKENPTQLKSHELELKFMSKVFLIAKFVTENSIALTSNINTIMRKEKKATQTNIRILFNEIGFIQVSLPNENFASEEEFEDKLTEHAIECDAQEVDDIDLSSKTATFTCNPNHIDRVKTSLLKLGYKIEYSENICIPLNTVTLTDDERKQYDSLLKRITQLEGFEKIYDNVEEE